MFDIIVVGSATRDVFLKGDNFESRAHADSPSGTEQCLPLGSKIEIKKIVFTTGGGGTNAAVTFARQGFKTACLGAIGQDLTGEEIIAELKKEGIETKFFQRHTDDFTAYSVILVNPNGERTILSYKGEGQHLMLDKISLDQLQGHGFYLDSLGGNYDLFQALVEHASLKGMKIASNPGGKELAHGLEKLSPLLKKIDIFCLNQEEGAGLLGLNVQDQNGVLEGLQALVKGIVVVTNGHQGVTVLDAQGKRFQAGVPDSPIVERTGAGDAFNSAFVAEYWRSGDVPGAIQLATANASSVVAQFGAKAGILKKGEWGPWPKVVVK